MSKETIQKVERGTFNYRCFVKKEFEKAVDYPLITPQFHLELGEKNEAGIVQDRNIDWIELANKDIDQCGLANVLKLVQRGLVDPSSFAFRDEEALDLGGLDPNDPNSIKKTISSTEANTKKLEAIAAKIGISTDELIDAVLKGSLADILVAKTAATTEEKKEAE